MKGGEYMDHVFSVVLTFFVHLMNPNPVKTDATVTADVTVDPSGTPTVTPLVTPTGTVTPTVTITPSVTPSVSPEPTGDGDKDDMFGLKADAHAFFGLMNAALHHEQNESRFEAKHGDKTSQSGE